MIQLWGTHNHGWNLENTHSQMYLIGSTLKPPGAGLLCVPYECVLELWKELGNASAAT